MSRQQTIASIDIGTDKITCIIAQKSPSTPQIQILGISSSKSKGIRKSQIVDLNQAIESMTEAVDAAERMAGMNIKSVQVNVSGAHIQAVNSKGVVAVAQPNQEITLDDVVRVIEAARAVSLPSGKEIIHIIPKNFKVDSQEGIKDPVGMTGIRLETEAHIITGSSTALKNIKKCVLEVGLEVGEFVFSGLAASSVTATETERELGVVVLDIGAGTTALSAFVDGSLEYSAVLPLGARHVTQDIALGYRISLESAEKLKHHLKTLPEFKPALPGETKDDARKRKKIEDAIDAQSLNIFDSVESFSRKTLSEGIIAPRLKELFDLVGKELSQKQLIDKVPAGVILTGGGAQTVDIVPVCKYTLQLPTRLGYPTGFEGVIDDIQKPQFACSLGLIKLGLSKQQSSASESSFSLPKFKFTSPQQLVSLIKKILKSLIP